VLIAQNYSVENVLRIKTFLRTNSHGKSPHFFDIAPDNIGIIGPFSFHQKVLCMHLEIFLYIQKDIIMRTKMG
jgi:hypothetical protein